MLASANDGTNRLFHVQQEGVIKHFPNVADPAPSTITTFLDIRGRVRGPSEGGEEEGLMSVAFDPDYATNGELYVYYSASNPRRTVVSRFKAPNPLSGPADLNSEEVLLEVNQPASDGLRPG
jgi:hypothetical protein